MLSVRGTLTIPRERLAKSSCPTTQRRRNVERSVMALLELLGQLPASQLLGPAQSMLLTWLQSWASCGTNIDSPSYWLH
jgi:hypothetical protein